MDELREQALKTAMMLAAPRYPLLGVQPAEEVYATISRIALGETEDRDACMVARDLLLRSRRHWDECKV